MRASAVFLSFMALTLSGFSMPSFAADPAMPLPLQTLEKEGAQIRYLGKDNGLDGWVTIKNGQEQYFYVTPDQQAIVLGVLFNNKGDIVTMRQIQALRKKDPEIDAIAQKAEAQAKAQMSETPPPAPPAAAEIAKNEVVPPVQTEEAKAPSAKAEQFYDSIENSSWLALGLKTAPVIYTIIDPQCPHCHDLLEDFRKSGMLEKGQVQVRVIPVGLMNELSLKQAANLIAAKDPQAALYKHLDGDKNALSTDPNANTQPVQRNMVLMQAWKIDVTPFSIYRDKAGKIQIIRGRPKDIKSLVAQLNAQPK